MIYQFWSILSIPFREEVMPSVRNADIVDIAVIWRFPNQTVVVGVAARSPGQPPD